MAGAILQKAIPSLEEERDPLRQHAPPLPSPACAAAAGEPYKTIEPPAPPAPGLLGKLQTAGGIVFLGLMGSCFYLIISVALYIVISVLFLGHRAFPFTIVVLWVAQAVAPIKQFEQDPPAMRRSWLFKEMARCVFLSGCWVSLD